MIEFGMEASIILQTTMQTRKPEKTITITTIIMAVAFVIKPMP